MNTIEHMRKWLAEKDYDVWESFSFDMRENYYYMAWDFWANNAPKSDIEYTYKEIQNHIARYGLSEGGDDEDGGNEGDGEGVGN